MEGLDGQTTTNMEVALDKVCEPFPHGGDHELRKYIAQRLIQSASEGNTTLGGLTMAAHSALLELSARRSA
jgi:hypothetical protein